MITLSRVSKWYPNFQVLKHCPTEVAKGEVWSCAVRRALASRRSSNASMGSSRFRKAPSRLCVPKIRFCNIGDEGRQGQVVMR